MDVQEAVSVHDSEIKSAREMLMRHCVPRLGREDAEELVQYSLADAAARYQRDKGAKFSTFAFLAYRGDLNNLLKKKYRRMRAKPHTPKVSDIAVARLYLGGEHSEEVGRLLGCSGQTVRVRLRAMGVPVKRRSFK